MVHGHSAFWERDVQGWVL